MIWRAASCSFFIFASLSSEAAQPDSSPLISQDRLYEISEIILRYQHDIQEPIPVSELIQVKVPLCEQEGAIYSSPPVAADGHSFCRPIDLSILEVNTVYAPARFSSSALRRILEGLRDFFGRRDIPLAVVYIPQGEIASDGTDVRMNKSGPLTIAIAVPIIKEMSVSQRDAEGSSKSAENSKLGKKITGHFPLTLPNPSEGIPGGVINSNVLNQYLYALNRHRNRRVDIEIGPSDMPGQFNLDFVLTQNRPYSVYFNANNNVPKPINRWQESTGFIHTQATGNDDIFQYDASTDSFDQFYWFAASYKAPIGQSIDNRWGISGGYSRFSSAEFALPQNLFVGTQAIFELEFIAAILQRKQFFLDFVADLQYRHIHNAKHFLFGSVTKNFLIPEIALKAVQLQRESRLIASMSLQSTMSSLFWDVKEGLDNLGRFDISPNWAILQVGFYGSSYLEPLFQKSDQVKHLAHEIVFIAQLQNAFNQRLIPELEAVLGGLYSIRGYPQSTIAGDNMYMGSFEYRFHVPGALDPRPNAYIKPFNQKLRWAPAVPKGETDWDFFIRAFYDVGGITVNQRRAPEKNYCIMGTGLGVELVLWTNIYIRGDWGMALRSANGISSGDNRYYYSSTIIF